MKSFKVVVRCITFNHSPYIEDTMNGFCMQQTDFPFLCMIVDDASTDGEQDVIKKYLKSNFLLDENNGMKTEETDDYTSIFAKHKKNANCFFVIIFLKYNHYQIKKSKTLYYDIYEKDAKYIALCEGDDYWIDSQKLQKQASFLDKYPDYVMCHTDYDYIGKKKFFRYKERYVDGLYFPYVFNDGIFVGTLTVMYRKSVYDLLPHYYRNKNWPMGDKPLWYELSTAGKIIFFPYVTARYRILPESASHSQDISKVIRFKEFGLEIKKFYAEKYGITLKNDGYSKSYYDSLLGYAFSFNRKDIAEKYFHEAKEKGLLSFLSILFYFGTKVKLIRKLIALFR